MADLVFFYGTLMAPFNRRERLHIDPSLTWVGHGRIAATLFDLGIYPAAVPSGEYLVRGEVHRMEHPVQVLRALDELEGYRPSEPESSLYTRELITVELESGETVTAWAYFYNAPLGRAERIASGDYLEYLKIR
ncbi:MAG: gamma-glutamylcyclotransferase [Vicinamibacterales bacterium]